MKVANRTLEIFEFFAREQQARSLTEIARGLEIPMSSCFNLVRSLEELGFLYTFDNSRRLYPTQKIFGVAEAILNGDQWLLRIEAKLEQLRSETQETVLLAKRQQRVVVYLSILDSPQQIRYTAKVGDIRPLHATAAGKALLSALPPERREKLVAQLPLQQRTKSTITDRRALLRHLEQCAQDGYAMTLGENVAEAAALAMPVELNEEIYAIVLAGPLSRMTANITSHKKRLAAMCKKLTLVKGAWNTSRRTR